MGGGTDNRKAHDKAMASAMKAAGIERWVGKCPVCYGYMPNDTHGGVGAINHMRVCAGQERANRKVA